MNDLNAFEDKLIAAFTEHPVLREIDQLSKEDFFLILLQRRFLSVAFTPAYDMAIDLLTDQPGVWIARAILREEYPDPTGGTPSHREDMREDLFRVGVPRRVFLETRPSRSTALAIEATLELIVDAGAGSHPDVALLTILRFWGEVLVSAEYSALWPRMAPSFTAERPSRFYQPHLVHDAKAHPLGSSSSQTHSDQLGARLWQLLGPAEAQACFRETEERILQVKTGFYDQFAPLRVTVAHL